MRARLTVKNQFFLTCAPGTFVPHLSGRLLVARFTMLAMPREQADEIRQAMNPTPSHLWREGQDGQAFHVILTEGALVF